MAKALFFIAIIPEGEIAGEITSFKKRCAKEFNSSRALNSPPHITLVPPFRYEKKEIQTLYPLLNDLSNKLSPFYISLNGFGHFGSKVIYVKTDRPDSLFKLHGTMKDQFYGLVGLEKNGGRDFHPHVTVAFKDLGPYHFKMAWQVFRDLEYFRMFRATGFHLLLHSEHQWHAIQNFKFN